MSTALEKLKEGIISTRPRFDELNINKIGFAQELEFAIQMFAGNDYLLKTNEQSRIDCLVNLSLTGLTLNPVLKFAYLVPRKGKCCVDPSYMGLVKILTDTGSVKDIKAKPVFENEPFEIELGTNGYVKHSIYRGTGSKGKRIGVYSIAVLNDGSTHIEWMYEAELMAIRARSESVKAKKTSPWDTDEDEMCRKTVVKRHWKYLPKSDRAIMAAQAIAFDDENNGIDLEQEKRDLDAQNNPKHGADTTPNNPDQEALATNEDLYRLLELIAIEEMPDGLFPSEKNPNGLTKEALSKGLQKMYTENTLVKSLAEAYIKGLESTLAKALEVKAAQAAEKPKEEAKPEAMATQVEMDNLLNLLADDDMPLVLFKSVEKPEGSPKSAVSTGLLTWFKQGKLTLNLYSGYYAALKQTLDAAKKAKQ